MPVGTEAKTRRKIRVKDLPTEAQDALRRKFPSRFWVPNRAQRRPISRWQDRSAYPRVHAVTFGNRTGKTEYLAEFLTGCIKGNKWVNPAFRCPFFDDLSAKRRAGTLTVWWCCDGEMMKETGPDYKIIRKHLPDAHFSSRANNGVFRQICVPVEGENRQTIELIVSVKTHDMDSLAYAGENVDVVICDEPLPQDKWSELAGRMVNLAGEMGGRVIIGGTPLKLAGYLLDIIEDGAGAGGRVVHDEGSIWENCDGRELPEAEAKRLDIPKDPDTGIYQTWGHLSVEGIRNAIENWKQSGDPDELAARVDGKFTHVQGRIYKNFSMDAHVIEPMPIQRSYPIIMVVDPHDARPDAAGWYTVTPTNRIICVAEYPTVPYELITGRSETIPQTIESWRKIEAELGISGQVVLRIADPNKMNDPDPYTGQRLCELYRKHGMVFDLKVNDDLEYGHEIVRQLLYFDREKFEAFPGQPMFQPHLLFFKTCRNHCVFMQKYTRKKWTDPEKPMPVEIDQKWKDFPDLVRYMAAKFSSYDGLRSRMESSNAEWKAIQARRRPAIPTLGFPGAGVLSSRGVLYSPPVPFNN